MPEEGFLGTFARMASTFIGGAPDGHKHVWNAIAPWVNELTRSASAHWLQHLVMGIPCEVLVRDASGLGIPCPGAAIAACSVCQAPTCLNHAFVNSAGAAVCFPCVATDIDEHHKPGQRVPPGSPRAPPRPRSESPPPPKSPRADLAALAAARKVLGVKRGTAWEDLEKRYRALLGLHHPDKHPGDPDATRRFVAIRSAYDLLKQAREAP